MTLLEIGKTYKNPPHFLEEGLVYFRNYLCTQPAFRRKEPFDCAQGREEKAQ